MPDSAAKKAWTAAHTTRIVMNLNHNTDADLLEKLAEVPSKQGYIKALIRADIERERRARSNMTRKQRQALDDFKALSDPQPSEK
ncbi:MAG: hypothetical protein LUD78_09410 [Clostridiales bacterium]|nr:hypothetical protein [Clostridiales bacterium]